MPRYKSNVRFGPWRAGDVFESTDLFHAVAAAEGFLTELGAPAAAGPDDLDVDGYYDQWADGDSDEDLTFEDGG